jgi:hypothetical protein
MGFFVPANVGEAGVGGTPPPQKKKKKKNKKPTNIYFM